MPMPAKPALTIATLAALLATPEVFPALKDYRIFDWSATQQVTAFRPTAAVRPAAPEPPVAPAPAPRRAGKSAKTGPVDDGPLLQDTGNELHRFYAALYAVEKKEPGAAVRVVHYGDSPTTADLITADVRDLFQQEFGDAGHGFALIANPWAWYGHRGLTIRGSGWRMEPGNTAELRDGRYGLGVVSFRGAAGAQSKITLKDPSHSRFEVWYLAQPDGGSFTVSAGGQTLGTVDTASPAVASQFQAFEPSGGAGGIDIRVTSGRVRLYGVRFSKDGPGVEYSSLGVNGAAITIVSRNMDEGHWGEQLKHAEPNLVVLNYGTNESAFPSYVEAVMEKELTRAIQRIRSAVPEASILLMSPMDRGDRLPSGEIGTVAGMARLIEIERKVARDHNVAFFNTFQAMGGAGTMGRWYTGTPRLVGADLIHPMPAGAKLVGGLLYRALQDGYRHRKLAMAQPNFETIKTQP
ncbi:MAG: hypothetical protein FJW38_19190 [Acidobacteria bacterium]|nr:hypothetical protein [Acidobacteriota bacterium]